MKYFEDYSLFWLSYGLDKQEPNIRQIRTNNITFYNFSNYRIININNIDNTCIKTSFGDCAGLYLLDFQGMVNLSPVKRDIKMEVDSDQTADIHQRTTCFQLIQKFTKEVQCTHDMEQDVVFK